MEVLCESVEFLQVFGPLGSSLGASNSVVIVSMVLDFVVSLVVLLSTIILTNKIKAIILLYFYFY